MPSIRSTATRRTHSSTCSRPTSGPSAMRPPPSRRRPTPPPRAAARAAGHRCASPRQGGNQHLRPQGRAPSRRGRSRLRSVSSSRRAGRSRGGHPRIFLPQGCGGHRHLRQEGRARLSRRGRLRSISSGHRAGLAVPGDALGACACACTCTAVQRARFTFEL
eukprot:2534405-Prymnesium_polylepis.1